MNLGSLSLVNNLFLAPMQNVSSAPFRRFCRTFQEIGLVCVPMIYTKRLMENPKSIEHELIKIEEERPISVQLIGSNLEALKKAIEYLESYNFDVIDINAGCPSKRAINASEGGFLLKDLNKLEEILKTAVKFSSKPISLKSRLGFENTDKIQELGKIVDNTGIDFMTSHARTVKNRFENDTLDLEALKKLEKTTSIPIVGNGDINNPKFAKYFLEHTKVDALMIGRESMGNPKIFNQVNEYLTRGREINFDNSMEQMKYFVEKYEQSIEEFLVGINLHFDHDKYKFTELKRNAIWLTKNIVDSANIRRELSKTKNLKGLKNALESIFNMEKKSTSL